MKRVLSAALAACLACAPFGATSQEAEKRPDAWYPRTETLGPDEMFVVALGTGMPTPITRAQKSSAWYVELGNGDTFLFDVGSGSTENLFALRPDFARVDKAFLSHLHSDHVGDVDALWVGGWLSGRYEPLHIYGPSGSEPRLGTAAFVEGLKMAYAWDIEGRAGTLPDRGGMLIAHEFDYKGENEIVYEANGVTIRSFPAVHSIDGSVSYRLDWNGLSFVFGGDSFPNKWFVEYAKGADFVVHELFYGPEDLETFLGFPPRQAMQVSSYIHTPPEAFGKIMAEVQPRLAVGYHSILVPEMLQSMSDTVRETYDGPLVIASDLMAWNITKDSIQQREVVSAERVQPPPTSPEYATAPRSGEAGYSDFINAGKWEGFTPPPLPE
ncbi:MAG: guanitoxin biosynthesis MBL fold metallo-hydrolase GntH [Dinoroseobacter sp.]|nr:guanitoxin biosynthesis MBL fold metallo-hydrolase GntH [Dinoroseobacter sp.]MDJ0995696.1 guanitoxin biosynthesis MBL fold metallo-hydrolase GntH [Dinoroseobacter sp.]